MSTPEPEGKKIALVTGASRGIGAATLEALGSSHEVHGTATGESGVKAIEEAIAASGHSGRAHQYRAGVPGDLDSLVSELPHVDTLVCNAGMARDGIFMRMSDEDFNAVIEANLAGPFKLARHYIKGMAKKRHGRIIMISSVVASMGNAGQANYVASKAGLEGLARTLANEYGKRGVTVNSVAPGFIDTDLTKNSMSDKVKESLVGLIPLGRVGNTSEVAKVISFLASDDASYITGATIHVNGGLSMG